MQRCAVSFVDCGLQRGCQRGGVDSLTLSFLSLWNLSLWVYWHKKGEPSRAGSPSRFTQKCNSGMADARSMVFTAIYWSVLAYDAPSCSSSLRNVA